MRKHLKLFALVACLFVAMITMASCAKIQVARIKRDPFAQLETSIAKTKAAMKAGMIQNPVDTFKSALENGALELSLATEDKTELTSTLYFRDDQFAAIGSIAIPGMEGEEATKMQYGLWGSEEYIVAQLPDESLRPIGVNLTTLKDDLKSSPLLEMFPISYEELCTMLDNTLYAMPEKNENGERDWRQLLQIRVQLQNLFKECSCAVGEGTLPVDTGKIDVYRISYTITPTQLCEAVDIISEWYATTNSYANTIGNHEEAAKQWQAAVDEYKKQIVSKNMTALCDFYISQDTQVIVETDIRVDWLEGQNAASVVTTLLLGENPTNSANYTLRLDIEIPGEPTERYTIQYQRTHAHNMPGRKLVVSNKTESHTVLDLQYNEINNAFDLKLLDEAFHLQGVASTKDNILTVATQIDGLGLLTMRLLPEAQLPAVPSYDNLCYMTKAELELLFQNQSQGGGEEYPDSEIILNQVSILGANDEYDYTEIYHNYDNVGDLLVAIGAAELDEDGNILAVWGVNVFEDQQIAGEEWQIFLDNEKVEGNPYEIPLTGNEMITLKATQKVK